MEFQANDLTVSLFSKCLFGLTSENFRDHYSKHLNGQINSLNKKIPCPKCDLSFSTFDSFHRHFNIIHPNDASKLFEKSSKNNQLNFSTVLTNTIIKNLKTAKDVQESLYKQNPIIATSSIAIEQDCQPHFSSSDPIISAFDDYDDTMDVDVSTSKNDLPSLFPEFETSFTYSTSNVTGLSVFQNDLITAMNKVRSENAITDSSLKAAFSEMSKVIFKNFHNKNFTDYNLEESRKAIYSSYSNSSNNLDYNQLTTEKGTVQYFFISQIISKYAKNEKFFKEILQER